MNKMTKYMTTTSPTTTKAELKFLKYIKTLEVINYRKEEQGVYVSKKETEIKFFPCPKFNCKGILNSLESEIRIYKSKGEPETASYSFGIAAKWLLKID